ncbi:uncharacterized protein N7511_001347 [Penicillium nucicola]|uniref:uncharacterized protein n=1 Tax=Penicillium nucicola TaxID=1850975 RepID=UPI0025455669|nr:uncharacterized protein N7511_001347 [Penicillium nucicola]KAJ5776336.1 hypothetical protein N7511_001347 [Penicillium nucicola]
MDKGSFDAGSAPQVLGTEASTAELSAAPSHGVASETSTRQSKRAKCRFFKSKKGCRLGSSCPYLHDASALESNRSPSEQQTPTEPLHGDTQTPVQEMVAGAQKLTMGGNQPKSTATSGPAQPKRPVSKLEQSDPREFQINQLRRRYQPQETNDDQGSILTFGLAPSDPDFPFELEKLQCVLRVPKSYPNERPTLTVTNAEMQAAYQANVARGFDDIVNFTIRTNNRGTLLTWLNSLDKQLEKLLTTLERGPTLKFFSNVGDATAPKEPSKVAEKAPSPSSSQTHAKPSTTRATRPTVAPQAQRPAPKHSVEAKATAEKRRALEVKQLEARLGRIPMFQKMQDGRTFIIPVQPAKKDRLPRALQALKTVKLIVPNFYPLEPSSIKLQGVDGPEAKATEAGFLQWVEQTSQLNLVSQINYLASNMHKFAETPLPEEKEISEDIVAKAEEEEEEVEEQEVEESTEAPTQDSEDRPHLHVIPRPPEWSVPDPHSGAEDTTEESSYDEDEHSEDEEDEEGGAPVPPSVDTSTPGRGVALSFPFLELYGIELLELSALNITVKCDRCKTAVDIKNVPQVSDEKGAIPKMESCRKCANNMSVAFRRQLMHTHANRAGYLDMDGCTIGDMLLSNFIPTCAECSTPHPAPGISAVRGESATASCRDCHRKMVFKIPEVKFLLVGSAAISGRGGLPLKRKPKEVLGIVAGQELPRRGRCQHYAKSQRWFRFSCCAKVFPCDKCHDAETDHPNEHANRMICGYCSREQVYRPENCGICKAILIGKAGSGFWEGGKGTRNRALMSRKDPRKFKRIGGNAPTSSASKRK